MNSTPRSLCFGVQFARDLGRSGGVIDDDGALAHAGEYAVAPQHHLAQIVVVADAGQDEVLALRRLGVGALLPPCCETHFAALAAVRL